MWKGVKKVSYFNGIIPEACRRCFFWNGQKWAQTDPGLCDECDHMLDMFPLIDEDKAREREKWELLSAMEEPLWIMPQGRAE